MAGKERKTMLAGGVGGEGNGRKEGGGGEGERGEAGVEEGCARNSQGSITARDRRVRIRAVKLNDAKPNEITRD